MKMIGIVAVMALLAGPAWAQNTQKYGDPDKVKLIGVNSIGRVEIECEGVVEGDAAIHAGGIGSQ